MSRRNAKSTATCGRWVIFDLVTRRPYVAVGWDTQEEAQNELEGLLFPYPEGHEWRERLEVRIY